ncbi:membrane protein [Halalkalibacter okhensis]|uniref:Membrane protein n=1 Tax=Halalkalibacter okhensis TaxID=333138 RepID=A0A0B0IJI7_9BACI|nr:membrane protein [Halalkalibacter okhensis]KHF41455.1 membrane protein [Halalkalibacter okhensis]
MNNFNPTNRERRFKAHVSAIGTTQLHLRNPYMIAWWSAAFPGFGHLLLSKYLRGYALFLWEILVNNMSNLNIAIVYSFTGNIGMAKEVLEPRWLLLYIPVYIFAIWDSYRTSVDMNKVFILAERENADFNSYTIAALEINYLDKRRPLMAVVWSLLTPGLGQLYIHRVLTAIFTMAFIIVFVYFSNVLVAIHYLFIGEIGQATQAIDPQWFLFMPSHFGFAVYDSYVNTVENNKLFESEQRKFLKENYQNYRVKIPISADEVK